MFNALFFNFKLKNSVETRRQKPTWLHLICTLCNVSVCVINLFGDAERGKVGRCAARYAGSLVSRINKTIWIKAGKLGRPWIVSSRRDAHHIGQSTGVGVGVRAAGVRLDSKSVIIPLFHFVQNISLEFKDTE